MRYVILPMQPTPNGRMHIGHGGGTYLRADVLARSLRAEGHDVAVACGTDAYENWVLAASAQDGRAPEVVCAENHAGILEDLRGLGIEFDVWIDPLAEEHRQGYLDLHTELFDEVVAGGMATLDVELIPYSVDDGSALMGTFIAGLCPNCGAPAGGSSCTACSEHFQPSQLVEPRSRLTDAAIEWREEKNWFLSPVSGADLIDALTRTGLADAHVAVAARYLARSGGRIRLSGPGAWGVRSPRLPDGRILANSYYLYCVYAARQVSGVDPFAAGSGITTVGVFGTDNTTPGLIVPGLYAQACFGRVDAFDHTVINGMLDLDGQKCSTSKRYGIWLADALGSGLLTADELRFALAGVDLDHGRANLDLAGLAATVTVFRELVRTRVAPAVLDSDGSAAADESLLAEQRSYLQPANVDLPRAQAFLHRHLASDPSDPARWLATLAGLSVALTPALSAAVTDPTAHLDTLLGRGEVSAAELEAVVRRGEGTA